jgi:hypothetical protein
MLMYFIAFFHCNLVLERKNQFINRMTLEYSVVAISRTKKQAKQQAAFKMLNRLKTSLADMLILPTSEKDGPSEDVCTIAGYLYFTNSHHIPYAAVSVYVYSFLLTF